MTGPAPLLQFRVYGLPGAQGSKHARPIYSGRVDLDATRAALFPYTGPVDITVVFVFTRPKSHYRTGRNAHLLRDNAPVRPTGKNVGDVDKLQRATFDALTSAGLWADDSLAADVHAHKIYGTRPGAHILIRASHHLDAGDFEDLRPAEEVASA